MMFKHVSNHLDSISRNLIFRHYESDQKLAVYSIVTVDFRISSKDHSKDHQKLWGLLIWIKYFINLSHKYIRSISRGGFDSSSFLQKDLEKFKTKCRPTTHLQLAVNCQPGYNQGPRRTSASEHNICFLDINDPTKK